MPFGLSRDNMNDNKYTIYCNFCGTPQRNSRVKTALVFLKTSATYLQGN